MNQRNTLSHNNTIIQQLNTSTHNELLTSVHDKKLLTLCGELFLNVFCAKDVLQIHPGALAYQPFVKSLRQHCRRKDREKTSEKVTTV